MNNQTKKKNTYFVSGLILLFTVLTPFNLFVVNADTVTIVSPEMVEKGVGADSSLEEQLKELERQIQALQNSKSSLQNQLNSNNYLIAGLNSQVSKIYGEAQIYQQEIDVLNLQIKALELNISELNSQITSKKTDIKKSEETITGLEKESSKRIRDSYYNFRMYGTTEAGSEVFVINNVNAYFKDSQYKEIIQSDTNSLMSRVAELKEELKTKKQELEDKLVEVKKNKDIIDVQMSDVRKKKDELDAKQAAYYAQINLIYIDNRNKQNSIQAFSQEEIIKKAQANKLQEQIFNSFNPVTPGEYVTAGKYIGNEGCTGLCTGAHLHFMVYYNNSLQNPCGFIPSGIISGCGGNGSVQMPLHGPITFTSGYGNRCFQWGNQNYCDFHNGIDIIGNPWNAPVYAAHDGYLFKGVDSYGANYVIICSEKNCRSGIKTGYWHLSRF